MSIWFSSVDLANGEQIRYQAAANTFIGRRLIGGQLTVTDQRLIFTPNRLDGVTGGRRRAIALNDVQAVEALQPGREAVKLRGFGAAVRTQIQIKDSTASALVVTVNDSNGLIRLLRP